MALLLHGSFRSFGVLVGSLYLLLFFSIIAVGTQPFYKFCAWFCLRSALPRDNCNMQGGFYLVICVLFSSCTICTVPLCSVRSFVFSVSAQLGVHHSGLQDCPLLTCESISLFFVCAIPGCLVVNELRAGLACGPMHSCTYMPSIRCVLLSRRSEKVWKLHPWK